MAEKNPAPAGFFIRYSFGTHLKNKKADLKRLTK